MVKMMKDEEEFKKEIGSGTAFVDFYADWCGPCRMLAPVIDKVAHEVSGVKFLKVNVEDMQDAVEKLGISSIPTLILFKNGKEVDRFVGVKDAEFIKKFVSK